MALTNYQGLFIMKKGGIFVEDYIAEFMNPANKPSIIINPEIKPSDSESQAQETITPKVKTKKTKEVKEVVEA